MSTQIPATDLTPGDIFTVGTETTRLVAIEVAPQGKRITSNALGMQVTTATPGIVAYRTAGTVKGNVVLNMRIANKRTGEPRMVTVVGRAPGF